MPTFAPIRLRRGRRSDLDHDAALRGLDVFLTRLPDAIGDKNNNGEDEEDFEDEDEEDGEEEDERWYMSGCSDGYVVLVKPQWNTKKVAVYDPLTGALHLFPGPPDEVFSGDPEETESEFHLIPSEAHDRSFRLLCVPKEKRGEQIAVLSPDSREWQISPAAGRLEDAENGTLVNGSVYWAFEGRANISVLNTQTLQFSHIDLPPPMRSFYGSETYKAGETNDGKLCLVSAAGLILDVWIRRAGDGGVDKWMQDREFRMTDAVEDLALGIRDECPGLNVVAIVCGTVYLSIHQNEPPNWLLSFCLETRELKKLCQITSSEFCYPYVMAWPPSLVRNKVSS
jgi:hypothetical protein